MSNAVLADLFAVKNGINKKIDGTEKRELTLLQLAALQLLFMLSDLLREGLRQEHKPMLLQVLTSYLLL